MADKAIRIVTPEFRLSFPTLFKGRAKQSDPTKVQFSISMLFPKATDLKELKTLCRDAMVSKFGSDPQKWPKGWRNPIQDGDEKTEWGGYEGNVYVRAATEIKPPVFDQDCNPVPDLEQQKVYAGMYCKAQVHAYPYDKAGNQGVAIGLDAVQLVRDGEPFAGSIDAEKTFGKVAGGASSKDDPKNYEKPAADPFNT
ncbi:MAG: ssDNA-binding protein [Verrucomicrobiota bacterium]